MKKNNTMLGNEAGVAFLEFTILFPLLLILSLGVFEFGRALQHYHVVNKSVRDAARYLGRVPVTCDSAGAGVGSIDSGHLTEAQNLAVTGEVNGGSALLNYWTNTSSVGIAVDCVDATSASPAYYTVNTDSGFIPIIRVTATVPYSDLGFLAILSLGNLTFTVSHNQIGIGE